MTLDSIGIGLGTRPGTTFVSLTVPAGWTCTPPPVGGTGNFGCLGGPRPPGNSVFTFVVNVSPSTPTNTVIQNFTSLGATDRGETAILGSSSTTLVAAPGAAGLTNIPTLDEVGLALLVLLLGMGGVVALRKRRPVR